MKTKTKSILLFALVFLLIVGIASATTYTNLFTRFGIEPKEREVANIDGCTENQMLIKGASDWECFDVVDFCEACGEVMEVECLDITGEPDLRVNGGQIEIKSGIGEGIHNAGGTYNWHDEYDFGTYTREDVYVGPSDGERDPIILYDPSLEGWYMRMESSAEGFPIFTNPNCDGNSIPSTGWFGLESKDFEIISKPIISIGGSSGEDDCTVEHGEKLASFGSCRSYTWTDGEEGSTTFEHGEEIYSPTDLSAGEEGWAGQAILECNDGEWNIKDVDCFESQGFDHGTGNPDPKWPSGTDSEGKLIAEDEGSADNFCEAMGYDMPRYLVTTGDVYLGNYRPWGEESFEICFDAYGDCMVCGDGINCAAISVIICDNEPGWGQLWDWDDFFD